MMKQTAAYWIKKLGLEKHPEGGWFKEIYRSAEKVRTPIGERNAGTSIYYLLEGDEFSAFHRIQSDEIWHYYAGTSAIEILWIAEGKLMQSLLGAGSGENLQVIVPKKHWFAARLINTRGFALAGCTVAPGFDFSDFELADQNLPEEFPELSAELKLLIQK